MPQFMIVLILYINLLNRSWIQQMLIFEEYEAFNICFQSSYSSNKQKCLARACGYFVTA